MGKEARGAQRPFEAEVRFGEEEGVVRGRAGEGERREVGGGEGRVRDRGGKRREKRRMLLLLLMRRNSGGSCMVPEPVCDCHARRVFQFDFSMERKACIRLIGGVRSPKGSSSHYMPCKKSCCSGSRRS